MKIAFVSDNGTTISRHFGRARQYVVVTVAEGREVARELRSKADCHGHHHHGANHAEHEHEHDHDHEHHDDMVQAIADCEVLIAGGMGAGMDRRLSAAGMRAIRTRIQDIDLALQQYLGGRLGDTIELVH